jgi:hypothetical protein
LGQRELILQFVSEHTFSCDDCIAVRLGTQPRQSVNIVARGLASRAAIVRAPGVCSQCGRQKIVNSVSDAGQMPSVAGDVSGGTHGVPAHDRRRRCRPILDGADALRQMLVRAGYRSVSHAIAEHAIFLHPDTVAQTDGQAVFPVVRAALNAPRGRVIEWTDGRRVWADDNLPPTCAFLWAARRRKGRDVQFNHVWSGGDAPRLYTALWNLCATPAFLAKATDTMPEVTDLLQYHAFILYGRMPANASVSEPEGYKDLQWASMPEPVASLEAVYRSAMRAAPKNRATIAARQLGWLFSGWERDPSL